MVTLLACVGPQEVTLIEREQRRLRGDYVRIREENRTVLRGLEGARSQLADTRASLQELQRDVNVLKEGIAELGHRIDRDLGRTARAGSESLREFRGRIVGLEEEVKAQGTLLKTREQELQILREAVLTVTQGPRSGVPARRGVEVRGATVEARATAPEEPPSVRLDYEDGLKLMERKDYRGAVARFKRFLGRHPRSGYADNAQYWVGESYYALKQFDQAILEFDAVRRNYPKGEKVPAALLKQGFAFAELGDKVDARLILLELIARYPDSREAVRAKEKVKELES